MEGVGLKFTPVVLRHLLGLLSLFGPMACTSWTILQMLVVGSQKTWEGVPSSFKT